MIIQAHLLRRRSRRERQALGLLRGDMSASAASQIEPLPPKEIRAIASLRKAALRLGLKVGLPAHIFVSADELTLLHWIELYQRQAPTTLAIRDAEFLKQLRVCSRVFTRIGLRLSLKGSPVPGARRSEVGDRYCLSTSHRHENALIKKCGHFGIFTPRSVE